MNGIKILGTHWPNIITARDYSTGDSYCEIHLRINFERTADTAAEIDRAIAAAKAQKDSSLRELKAILRRELERADLANQGNLALVNALSLP